MDNDIKSEIVKEIVERMLNGDFDIENDDVTIDLTNGKTLRLHLEN